MQDLLRRSTHPLARLRRRWINDGHHRWADLPPLALHALWRRRQAEGGRQARRTLADQDTPGLLLLEAGAWPRPWTMVRWCQGRQVLVRGRGGPAELKALDWSSVLLLAPGVQPLWSGLPALMLALARAEGPGGWVGDALECRPWRRRPLLRPGWDPLLWTLDADLADHLVLSRELWPLVIEAADGVSSPLRLLPTLGGGRIPMVKLPWVLARRPPARAAERLKAALDRRRQLSPPGPGLTYSLAPSPGLLQLQVGPGFRCPSLEVLIPTIQAPLASGGTAVNRLLRSFAATIWPPERLLLHLGDDLGRPQSLDLAASGFPTRVADTRGLRSEGFHYARKLNAMARGSRADLLLFLNDDVVVTDPDWLRQLAALLQHQGGGLVAPLLLFADGRVQHAGVIGGLLGLASHPWAGEAPARLGPMAQVQRACTLLTGACLLTARSDFEAVGGYDESYPVEFNDLDLCLRYREAGRPVTLDPSAWLQHDEGLSRAGDPRREQGRERFQARWGEVLRHDPAVHPSLSRTHRRLRPE
ncbi:MAG: glycosyltransferase [Prochlorococcaceae cyanobacterium]